MSASTFDSCRNSSAAGASKQPRRLVEQLRIDGRKREIGHGIPGTVWILIIVGPRRPPAQVTHLTYLWPRYVAATRGLPRQTSARALDHDFARFQHVAVVRDLQRGPRVLLDQQDRHAARLERADNAENLLHDQRRESQARFVEHQQPGLGHQCPAQREHLPLAARQRARKLLRAAPRGAESADKPRLAWRRSSCRRSGSAGTRRARGCRPPSSRRTARVAPARDTCRRRRAARPALALHLAP